MDGQGTQRRRKIAENSNGVSRVHECYRRQTTDGRTTTYSEREREFTSRSRSLKTREQICTINGSKRVKSAKDVHFGGFVKNVHPTLLAPKFRKILHYKSRFLLKTRINLGGSATKIRI